MIDTITLYPFTEIEIDLLKSLTQFEINLMKITDIAQNLIVTVTINTVQQTAVIKLYIYYV